MIKDLYPSLVRWVVHFNVGIVVLIMPIGGNQNYLDNLVTIKLLPYKPKQQLIGYFTSWSIYNKEYPYDIKYVVDSGAAEKLTVLNYAFSNVVDGACELGDPWGDYEKPFDEERSVDGIADEATQGLKGNFNQLKKLKKLYPDLKLVIALGGWTWSSHFSDAALTDESRKSFVSSCIELFIKGNLPNQAEGIAKGIFDGIEIDWEYPAARGHPSNIYREEDTVNFTALLQEFRKQLDEIDTEFILSIAAPAGENRYKRIELDKAVSYLNWVNLMTYDFRGAWDKTTFHTANLYDSESSPSALNLSTHKTVQAYLDAGVPAEKLVVGFPFYGVGWSVTSSDSNGLYQVVKESVGHSSYRFLANLLADSHTRYWDDDSKAAWLFDGDTFWTFEDAEVASHKVSYIKEKQLAGAMVWSLSGDDEEASLLRAVHEELFTHNTYR